jgi:cleavage and polyadenylation specificity factor subunit 2
VDFEGKADGKSVRTLITQSSPRRVMIVHGNAKETKALKDALREGLPGVDIDTPDAGKTIDCTSASATYKIRLSDALFQKAKMRDMAGYKVGWINGIVGKALEEGGAPMLLPLSNAESTAITTTSDALVKKVSAQPGSVFLGDLRLSDFRQVLAQEGIPAEFADGVLVCANGKVTVRKGVDEKLVVEGALSNEYFDVRSILYHQYQIL